MHFQTSIEINRFYYIDKINLFKTIHLTNHRWWILSSSSNWFVSIFNHFMILSFSMYRWGLMINVKCYISLYIIFFFSNKNYLSMSHHLSSLINLFYTLDFIKHFVIHFANIKAPNLKESLNFWSLKMDFGCCCLRASDSAE